MISWCYTFILKNSNVFVAISCDHWTTVVFIELLVYIELTKKLICTCSPTLVLTKGTQVHQRKVSSARRIVYTAHFIRAGLDFQDCVPVLSVLGLPLDMVRARVKFWSDTDGAKSFTRLNLSVPNQFFWYAYFFHPSRAKHFRPCKWGLNLAFAALSLTFIRGHKTFPVFHADRLTVTNVGLPCRRSPEFGKYNVIG